MEEDKDTSLYFEKAKEIVLSIMIKNKNGTSYSINERSKGCRWFFSFLLFTLLRQSENCIFLLDEPGSNLHGETQKTIIQAFQEISKNSLVVYSTHSPHLLDLKHMDHSYLMSNISEKEEEAPQIQAQKYEDFLESNHKNKDNYLQPLLDYIAIDMITTIKPEDSKIKEMRKKIFNKLKDIAKKENIDKILNLINAAEKMKDYL